MNDQEFTLAYQQYADMVYQIAFLVVGNRSEAGEVMQEVFVKLLYRRQGFAGQEHLRAWLITATRNAGRDILRSFWRRRRVGSGQLAELAAAEAEPEVCADMLAALLKLKPRYRVVVYLYYYVGFSTDEIGGILGINHNTVRSQLSVARKKLALLLEEEV